MKTEGLDRLETFIDTGLTFTLLLLSFVGAEGTIMFGFAGLIPRATRRVAGGDRKFIGVLISSLCCIVTVEILSPRYEAVVFNPINTTI